MASGALCQLCARPSGDDAVACTTCAQKATQALSGVVEWLADDLVTATARQTALGGGRGGGKPTKASEAPLPLDLRASEALSVLRSTLSGWVRVIADDHHGSYPDNTVKAMAKWLIPVIGWARGQEYGAELIDEITAAVAQALRVVDIQEERVGVGRCPNCSHPVYAPATRLVAYCRTEDCDGTVDVTQWQQSLQILAWSHEAGATEIAAFATKHLGMKLAASTIRSWATRGRITPTNPGEPVPRYRFEDVAKLAGMAQEVAA